MVRVLARPGLLVRRRLEAFERHLPRAARGEVDGIHDARVASRRLREVLLLLEEVAGTVALEELRQGFRELTRPMGPVRELDVALADLAELEPACPEHAQAIAAVREAAQRERESAARHLGRALAPLHPGHLVRQAAGLALRINSPEERIRCALLAAGQLQERDTALQDAVLAAGSIYAAGPLHDLRIALKKFRYALEVVEALGRLRLMATLRRLKALQDLLGQLHDLHVLSTRVRDAGAEERGARRRKELDAFATVIDDRIRQLHSSYLTERETLVPVLRVARRAGQQLEKTPCTRPARST